MTKFLFSAVAAALLTMLLFSFCPLGSFPFVVFSLIDAKHTHTAAQSERKIK